METHNDVVELAEQFRELHEMFVDFSALVAQQDELIDLIDRNCEKAVDYVETGVENIQQAKVYQKRGRNVGCILIIVIIIIAIVLVVVAMAITGGVCFKLFVVLYILFRSWAISKPLALFN